MTPGHAVAEVKATILPLAGPTTTELGEAPLWLPASGELVWLDVMEPALLVLPAWDAPEARRIPLPRPPGALAPVAGAGRRVLIALRHGLMLCDLAEGTLSELPMRGLDLGDRRFNDGRCDAEGRLWLGMMDRRLSQPIGGLACIGPGGQARAAAAGIILSNGVAFSPDGRTLYLADTRAGLILAHDFDMATGTAAGRRVFLAFPPGGERPDGCAVDTEGCLWIAAMAGGRIIRADPAGRIVGQIRLPVSKPTSCTFGGPGRDILFVTTARHAMGPAELAAEPLAGKLLMIPDIGARGLEEHAFRLESSR